jgi:DNA-binding NarL/FixJ family response regulator
VTIRVVIADDQAVVRAGFRTILESEEDIAVVGEAADGEAAVTAARRHRPDLVLMDVRMPGTDGIAATRRLAGAAVPDPVPVLVVAAGDGLVAPAVTRRLIAEFARTSPPQAARDDLLAPLTDREREILLLIARGLSNGEIADALVVSASTVKTHVGNLLAKLGCRDRVQAVVLAYERGAVRPGR